MTAWLADRQGAIVGADLAKRFGWKVGDRIPAPGHDLAAEAGPGLGLQHRRHLRRRRRRRQDAVLLPLRLPRREPRGGRGPGRLVRREDRRSVAGRRRWARTFDEMFANSSAETKTTTEKGFVEGFAKQIGDIGAIMIAILVAVLFTMLLVAANTMAQSVRERTSEVGVLKTLGFSNAAILALVLGESLFIALHRRRRSACWLAWLFVQQGDPTGGMLPIFVLPTRDVVDRRRADRRCWACSPARCRPLSAMRLRITDALRRSLTMFDWIRQTVAVTALNLRTIPQRLGSSAVAIVGIAGVVVVLVSVLSIAAGFTAAMQRLRLADARARHAQRRRQRDDERPRRAPRSTSSSRRRACAATARPPLASAELYVDHRPAEEVSTDTAGQRADARRRADGAGGARRGVDRRGPDVRSSAPTRSIVGRGASGQFAGLDRRRRRSGPGQNTLEGRRHLRGRRRRRRDRDLVRRARAAGRLPPRQHATRRCSRGSTRADAFDTFRDWLTSNPQVNVQVRRENEYYAQQSQALTRPDPGRRLRHRRADGHRRGVRRHPDDVHGGVDAVARDRHAARARLQHHVGGRVGARRVAGARRPSAASSAASPPTSAFNGYQTSTMNFQTFSQVAFAFRVTPQLLVMGSVYALADGTDRRPVPRDARGAAADSDRAARAVDAGLRMDLKTALSVTAISGLSLVVGQTAGPTLTVSAAARSLQPGELVVLTVTADSPVDSMTATAFGRALAPDRVDARNWRFLVGIDLDVAPGTHQVTVAARSGTGSISVPHPLTVEPKVFRTRTLTVDEGFVNPPDAVRSRIADEAARLERCWRESSTARRWSGPFVRPVDHPANSAFGTRSIFNGQARSAHSGADFLSPAGTPIRAANAGRVMLADQLYYSGGTVVIDHGLGVVSLYAHLSAIDTRAGDTVPAGHIVGRVGATGRVTGAHLHWTVRVGGARVDPLSLLAMLGDGAGQSHRP